MVPHTIKNKLYLMKVNISLLGFAIGDTPNHVNKYAIDDLSLSINLGVTSAAILEENIKLFPQE